MHTMRNMESNKEAQNMEKAYRTMKNSGAGSIAIGIIVLVVGITVGVLSIVSGANLLKHKSEITF